MSNKAHKNYGANYGDKSRGMVHNYGDNYGANGYGRQGKVQSVVNNFGK